MYPELSDMVVGRLERALDVPIPIQDCVASRLMFGHLFREWLIFLGHYKRHSPLLNTYLVYRKDAGKFYAPETLGRKLERLEGWIDQARKDFLKSKTAFFFNCKMLRREKRPKHWKGKNVSRENLRDWSKESGESVFLSEIRESHLLQGLWLAMAAHFFDFKKHKRHFVVDFEIHVGFSAGELTSLAQYEVDYTAVHAHGFPILAGEEEDYPVVKMSDMGVKFILHPEKENE